MVPDLITSRANERVKYLRSLHEARGRRRERAFLVEGVRLLAEALDAGVKPKLVLIVPEQLERSARGRELLSRLRQYQPLPATEQALAGVCETTTPQGVVAAMPMPEDGDEAFPGPLVVVLDGLADPGNVGTILRTAWACGVVQDVAAMSSASLYSPKVVRAAAGAHFHLRLVEGEDWHELQAKLRGRRLLVASPHRGTPHYDANWHERSVLIIGGEAEGARGEILAAADELVHIPMRGGAESINAAVATGVLLFEAARHWPEHAI